MDAPEVAAAQIRDRMREIRRDLRADVKGIVANASHMFDWRSYVRSFPWGSLVAAATVGYLLVPRRPKIVKPGQASVEAMVRECPTTAPPPPAVAPVVPTPAQASLGGILLSTVGAFALRAGVNYATKIGLSMLEDALASSQHPPAADRDPRPAAGSITSESGMQKSVMGVRPS